MSHTAMQATARGLASWLISWVMSFKLLAVALRQGSLRHERNALLFAVKLVLPVLPVTAFDHGRPRAAQSAQLSAAKMALAAALIVFLNPLLHAMIITDEWHPPLSLPLQVFLEGAHSAAVHSCRAAFFASQKLCI